MNERLDMKKLDIIYEDKDFLVVNKPAGLLTISDGKTNNTLYSMARIYVKKQNPHNKIFIVHRLDKDTSGVILFSKNEKLKYLLQNDWNNLCLVREYYAIVEGIMPKEKDTLTNYLQESKTHQVYVTNNKRLGKLAITNYEVIEAKNNKSLLKINIETGRKNQIRCQLAFINHPIIGDRLYHNKAKRLMLHATKLVIVQPITKQTYTFISPVPFVLSKGSL